MEKTINNTTNENKKTRVAAYVRFIAEPAIPGYGHDAQYEDYKEKITSNPNYEFVGVYADEVSTDTRENFDAMIKDALDGKIDLIIIKSVSRLGRNAAENLNIIKPLRDKGVGIYFEHQNMNTIDPRFDLVIAVLQSLAAEEEYDETDEE